LKNRYVQAILRGLKPCIIGIILATGCFMIMNNCISITTGAALNGRALVISLILALVYFGSRKVLKKGLSPIMLSVISACLGMAMYGV
jgi:chromate transporter